MGPVAGLELVLDQPVGGLGVGHAQQRLGQHHQRQALLGGKRIGVQKILHPAQTADAGADRPPQAAGEDIDARLGGLGTRGFRQQGGGERLVRRRVRRLEGRNVAGRGRGRFRCHG
jgi:hypothetical protein